MLQILNPKQIQMTQIQNSKQYDLEERTFKFAARVRDFVRKLARTISNIEDVKQLIRSSGSLGANYIETNEALSRKDFVHRIKICCKETKETIYWLKLFDTGNNPGQENERQTLLGEATEIMKIFGSIIGKSK